MAYRHQPTSSPILSLDKKTTARHIETYMGGGGSPQPAPDPYAQDRIDQQKARAAYEKERQEVYIPRSKEMMAASDAQKTDFYKLINQYYRDTNPLRTTPVTDYSVPEDKRGLGI